jgi:hypothetical protein
MQTFTVEKYMTEAKLAAILRELTGTSFGEQFQIPGRAFRWDMSYELGGKRFLVEYDGDEHYRNSLVIRADREKARIATENGFESIRFPYWLQLDDFSLEHFFGLRAHIVQEFPHGFITTKLFPASYCELGVERFAAELNSLPERLRWPVLVSLREKSERFGIEYVLPTTLRPLLAA